MDEVRTANNIILVIDEVHTLIGAGAAEGAIDAANILNQLYHVVNFNVLVQQLLKSIESILKKMLLLNVVSNQ